MAVQPKDVIIVGGGPAGLAAAVELYRKGVRNILIIEREKSLGGILRQCIHDGFGLTRFHKTLSGPEYAGYFIDEAEKLGISYLTDATVLDISPDKTVRVASKKGLLTYRAKAVVLAMGCRERTRGAIGIPGTRPSGIYTAGVAQSYINLQNKMVGKEVVILGSGDIGMIMARRLTLEGAKVKAVFEIQPYPSGLPRNIEQCLNDYGIPLYLSHTVTEIKGTSRLEGVTVAKVDDHMNPIPGTEREYTCDTLILSVGLIPENELSLAAGVSLDRRTKGAVVDENYQTDVEGIFAAGNVLQVHDLVDFVSMEAERLADAVARYVSGDALEPCGLNVETDGNIGYTVPQKISGEKDFILSLRVKKPMRDCEIRVSQNGKPVKTVKIKKALPAVMVQIPVPKKALNGAGDLQVSVSGGDAAAGRPECFGQEAKILEGGKTVREYMCIMCPRGCDIEAKIENGKIISIEGSSCPKGREYVTQELTDPRRNIASSVLVTNGELPLASVRLDKTIPKNRIFDVMGEIRKVRLAAPVHTGQTVIGNVLDLGSDVIATKNVRAV